MAAPNQEITAVNLLLLAGGSLIGSQSGARLSMPTELREIITKDRSDWSRNIAGRREWSVAHDGLFVNAAGNEFVANPQNEGGTPGIVLEIEDPQSAGTYAAIPGARSGSLTLTQRLEPVGGIEKPLWNYVRPSRRSFKLDLSGAYYDPASSAGAVLGWLFGYKDAGTPIPFRLQVAELTFEGAALAGAVELNAGSEGAAELSLPFGGDGALSMTGTPHSGIALLLSNFFSKQALTVRMEHRESVSGAPAASATEGSTYFSGSGYISETTISFENAAEVGISSTIMGDGPLTFDTVPVV